MFRSLHMKLVLIMVLLIVSLMTVVGAFLINSVTQFYLADFYSQMNDMFSRDTEFVRDLTTQAQPGEDNAAALWEVLSAYRGDLGVDGRNRNIFVLDGDTGVYLVGSDEVAGPNLDSTPNLMTPVGRGEVGDESDITADYMDLAIPITRGSGSYVVYILDNRQTVQDLNGELF